MSTIAGLESQIKETQNRIALTAGHPNIQSVYSAKLVRLQKELYQLIWGEQVAYATWAIGTPVYKSDMTCANAEFVLPDCDNTNLDEQGYCGICDHYHFRWIPACTCVAEVPVMAFDKDAGCVVKVGSRVVRTGEMVQKHSGSPRSDQGCDTFGDGLTGGFGANDLMMPGSEPATYDDQPGGSQAKRIRHFENNKEIK